MQYPVRLSTSALQLVIALALCTLITVGAETDFQGNSAGGYSPELAEQMALLSSSAYCTNHAEILNWTCEPCQYNADLTGCSTQGIAQTGSVLAYVAICQDLNVVVAAFRGTNNVDNFLQDGFAVPTRYDAFPEAYVHKGFYDDWRSIRTNMIQMIKESIAAIPSSASVYVTGHSLGASLATLAAADWANEPGIELAARESTRIYTFGQPRVGNKAFSNAIANLYGTRFLRIVNAADIVPHLPPKVLYYHAAGEIWYPKVGPSPKDHYVYCSHPESPDCSDSVRTGDFSVQDHLKYWNVDFGKCQADNPTT